MPIIITPATPEDSSAIVAITRTTYAATYRHTDGTPCFTESELDAISQSIMVPDSEESKRDDVMLVAKKDGVVIGYAMMSLSQNTAKTKAPSLVVDEKTAFLSKLYVDPKYQGCGAGNYLLIQMFRQAIARGKTKMDLEVWDGNPKSIGYYTKNGFKVVSLYEFPPVANGIVYRGYHMRNTDLEMYRRELVLHQLDAQIRESAKEKTTKPKSAFTSAQDPTQFLVRAPKSVRFNDHAQAQAQAQAQAALKLAKMLMFYAPPKPPIEALPQFETYHRGHVPSVTPPNSPIVGPPNMKFCRN